MAFPDVTGLLVTHLNAIHTPLVASKVPTERPVELVQVRRVGGPELPPVRDRARMDFIHWAATEPRANLLADITRTAVWALGGNDVLGVMVYRVTPFMGLRQATDDETGSPMAWCTFELDVRADDVIHFTPAPAS